MSVAVVSGARPPVPMGLELAELRLYAALRARGALDLRVVGGRAARAHARRTGGRWVPARPGRPRRGAWRGARLVHLVGLDLPPPERTPFVAMVHDLAALRYDDEGSLPPWTAEIVGGAACVFTPSAFTAGELAAVFGTPRDRIRVIGGGPALATDAEPLSLDELRALGIEPPFVLRCGGWTARKNVPLLLDAWHRVDGATLVLAGPPQPARDALLAEAPGRVVALDYVEAGLLARLLRSASALASTSSYEGFGLPVLEALAAGTPVVAVRTPFTEEMCGDAALLVEPRPEAVAAALGDVLADGHGLRRAGRERAAAFTWARAADAVLSAYASASTSL